MIPAAQLANDCDRLFDDWSVPAVWREATRLYDPALATIDDAFTDSDIRVIPTPVSHTSVPGTADLYQPGATAFLIRTQNIPPTAHTSTVFLLHNGVDYAVRSITSAAITGLSLILCQHP